jgi:hypothetical protein
MHQTDDYRSQRISHAPPPREIKNEPQAPDAPHLASLPPDLPTLATSVSTEPQSVIPAAPTFHPLRFYLLPWCACGDHELIAGVARPSRGAPPPELLDDEDSLSASSPPFVPKPDAGERASLHPQARFQ